VSLATRSARSKGPPIQPPALSTWRRDWSESFGHRWAIDLAVMALVVFCFGASRPLADPDLPMHLAVGEWISRHGAVPLTEPFAWTRPGAPYFAYSWLPQTAFYLIFDALGPLGLRALQGVLVCLSGLAVLVLARAAGWRASQAVMLAGLNLIVGSLFVGYLRPQSILLITMPLAWAGFLLIMKGRVAVGAATLFAASAVTANSHLFFPLTMAPAALLWTSRDTRAAIRGGMIGILSVAAGWLASPYSLKWVEVFRHNFGANPLFGPPSMITELQPGFVTLLHPAPHPMLLLVLAMLAMPWVLARASLDRRQLVLSWMFWSAGVLLFGFATRLFVAWWVLTMLSVGWTLSHLTRGSEEGPPRLRFRVLLYAGAVAIVSTQLLKTRDQRAIEGDTMTRTLPTLGARPAERLASWLRDHTAPDSRGRILTTFSFGSYLTWRLPGYSASIDTRAVFPDSVSGAEGVVLAFERDVPLGPWRSADLAILPLRYRVATTLDTASQWQRLAAVRDVTLPRDSVALWAKREWWDRNGRLSSRR
jgi:hypothetical protein